MNIIRNIDDIDRPVVKPVIALGTFDGVHLGHQAILSRAVRDARAIGGTSVVFTFDRHPLAVLRPRLCPPFLTTKEEQISLFHAQEVDMVIILTFDREFAAIPAEAFVHEILWGKLAPAIVVIGPNYTFGRHGQGTAELLTAMGQRLGFRVEVMEPVYVDGIMVSSTAIRKLISEGRIAEASRMLGRYPSISGKVVYGDGRGRRLGYPTANVTLPPGLVVPADGVYAVNVEINGRIWPGIANIGNNPTFKGIGRRLEVHLFNFSGDLYDREIRVVFFRQIRPEMVFPDAAALKRQIRQDIEAARKYSAVRSE